MNELKQVVDKFNEQLDITLQSCKKVRELLENHDCHVSPEDGCECSKIKTNE